MISLGLHWRIAVDLNEMGEPLIDTRNMKQALGCA